jgi:MscS family membrane protein
VSLQFLKAAYETALSKLAEMDWERIIFAVIVISVITLARRFLADRSLKLLRAAAQRFGIQINDKLRDALQPAGEMFVFALGLLVTIKIIEPPGQIAIVAEKIAVSILVASLFYGAYKSTQLSATFLQSQSSKRHSMDLGWIEQILRVISFILGIASVLKIWGIDLGPMVTGVGVAGAAVALAAQDLVKNFVGGMSNMAERRFDVGDWIRAEGVVEGVVENVALRSTAIRRFDMALAHVPNGELANAPLVNVSKMKHRRISLTVKLHYATSVDQLASIANSIKSYISSSSKFAQPPAASQHVRVDEFSDTAINLLVYCFTLSTAYGDYLEIKEDLIFEIKRAVNESSARFAYESRTLYIENASDIGQDHAVRQL